MNIISIGNTIESAISGGFARVGRIVARHPKKTLAATLGLAAVCGVGVSKLTQESRPEKLWVPQNTRAEVETASYQKYFPRSSRANLVIVEPRNQGGDDNNNNNNMLTKENLREVMELHLALETRTTRAVDGAEYTFTDVCTPSGGACATFDPSRAICQCLVISILKQWNYDLATLEADDDVLGTLSNFGNEEDLRDALGNPTFDPDTGKVLTADAVSLNYFLRDRATVTNGRYEDAVNEAWEGDVFLDTLQNVGSDYSLKASFLSARSFSDEFGGAISGDLVYVQVSYVLALVFLGATLGRFRCGPGSRWSMAVSALFLVGLSTVAGFGVSAGLFGLFFGPVHSLLPFILLGIGVDDVFVIVNAFNRERTTARRREDDDMLTQRASRALSRAGASITVTSATDLVAFAISSSSALPALASFCAYASICIFFLWLYATTFFTATMVMDETRQRDNRRDCLCCLKRHQELTEAQDQDDGPDEGYLSQYFRKYHGPVLLAKPGQAAVLLFFAALLGYGVYGAANLSVEDSERKFIPKDSYVNDFVDASDKYFSNGVSFSLVFTDQEAVFQNRDRLANLRTELTGLSTDAPYIAEPESDDNYQNVMEGFQFYLQQVKNTNATTASMVPLGDDGWPTNTPDFVTALASFASPTGPGANYVTDVSFDQADGSLLSYKVNLKHVKLLKNNRGRIIDDADKLIDAMDQTRALLVEDKFDDLPGTFVYSDKYIAVEGFKIIKLELFRNVGLAVACVGVLVLVTVASFGTAVLVTLNVAFCILEILGFMYALGVVIDSVSVINIVLAVGLSVDYSAHVGHCFMTKGGNDRRQRATEALADIGSSVLNGATSTFLAVAVLLFSSSYVFQTLSVQFALTVVLGILHGLVLLPVMLSLVGPAPFASVEQEKEVEKAVGVVHPEQQNTVDRDEEEKKDDGDDVQSGKFQ